MPGVAGQLVRVLSAPRPLANGTYTVTVSLHPESLGTVQATVTGSDSRLSVQLVAATSDGAAALRQSLPELREALSANGQQAIVTLSGGGSQGSGTGSLADGTPGGGQSPGGGGARQGGGSTAVPAPAAAATDSGATTVTVPPGSAGGTGTRGGRLLDVHV